MLFNSPEFIYCFLPLTVGIWWWLQSLRLGVAAQWFLVACALLFYGWWDAGYVPLLAGSASANYWLGYALAKTRSKSLLRLGVLLNIGILCYFKYADFLIENWNSVSAHTVGLLHIVLPLGISFFTFQVIAYLVDAYKGLVTDFNFRRFAFSISFFPHLIAGPILHYADVMPQLSRRIRFDPNAFSQGLFLLAVGLFKKTAIADRIAETVDPMFAADTALPLFEAWTAAVGYGLQIYFDFSGYSDMAIGIGLLFAVRLPLNFNSPYQALDIADFWKRWHMTLSRFLRDYVYIPLGGNRAGFAKGIMAAAATMLVGGIWHGAAWTFVAWGLLHGFYIGCHRLWLKTGFKLPGWLASALTFGCVTAAWVVFRAMSMGHAVSIWHGMAGLNGIAVPTEVNALCPDCPPTTLINGLETIQYGVLLWWCRSQPNSQEEAQALAPNATTLALVSSLFFISLFLPGAHDGFIYWQF